MGDIVYIYVEVTGSENIEAIILAGFCLL